MVEIARRPTGILEESMPRAAPSKVGKEVIVMAKRILVPLDRSDAAQSVLPLVADMARSNGATVRLLNQPGSKLPVNCDAAAYSPVDEFFEGGPE